MCLILFAWRVVPGLPLVVAANRDEFHARPTAPAARWYDQPSVFGGRDLQDGGTWLAIAGSGGSAARFAAVTNVADEPPQLSPAMRSRGELTANFLTGTVDAASYAAAVRAQADSYRGFNLLVGDAGGLFYVSNRGTPRGDGARCLEPGIYGLSNHVLDVPWPKVRRGKAALAAAVATGARPANLLALLADRTVASDDELPRRGRDLAVERRSSPVFIVGPAYGTRASTLVIASGAEAAFVEHSFGADGEVQAEVSTRVPFGIA